MYSRNAVVKLAESWVGMNEKNGSHKQIVDIYNSSSNPLPRNLKMQYNWAWCACTWSALAIKLGYTAIMPIEISCGFLIDQAKAMGCWVEDDAYIPKPGDAVLYDWQDKSGKADNYGWPDHVGVVTYVNEPAGYFVVTEGNYNDSVKKRTVLINGAYIRGFITPKYDEDLEWNNELKGGKPDKEIAHEVITGLWGNGEERRRNLEACGYDYEQIRYLVNLILNGEADANEVKDTNPDQPTKKQVVATAYARFKDQSYTGNYRTTANLYCRNDAGTNKKALCLIPKGTIVRNYGYFNRCNGVDWLFVHVILDGVAYNGYCHSGYLSAVK